MSRNYLAAALAPGGLLLAAASAQATPVGVGGYAVTTFASAPAGASAPDSIAVVGNDVYVGYGNGGAPDGSGGAVSTIAKFSRTGALLGTTSVVGHNDGLRYNAATGQLWALQNEDANPNLVLINPSSLAKSAPLSFSATPHGGGYDDVAFGAGGTFISASNPAGPPFPNPALVSATITGGTVAITGVLNGNAPATIINPPGGSTTLSLSDPDSLIFAPDGRLVLDSQGDSELVFVTDPGMLSQSAAVLSLTNQVDDTVFGGSGDSTLLFANKGDGSVYAVTGAFGPGTAFSAAASNSGVPGTDFIGSLNLTDGALTPVVTGANNPGGEAFLGAAVPEPASFALLGGMFGLLGLVRRRI